MISSVYCARIDRDRNVFLHTEIIQCKRMAMDGSRNAHWIMYMTLACNGWIDWYYLYLNWAARVWLLLFIKTNGNGFKLWDGNAMFEREWEWHHLPTNNSWLGHHYKCTLTRLNCMNVIGYIHERFTAHVRLLPGPRRAGEIFWEGHHFLLYSPSFTTIFSLFFDFAFALLIIYHFALCANIKLRTEIYI